MLKTILAAAALALAAPALAAQPAEPAPAAEPDPEALAEARALLRDGDFDEQIEEGVRLSTDSTFTTMLREMAEQEGHEIPADLEARFREILREHSDGFIAEMRATALEDSARVYARYFTAAEIRELRRLQAHPVMIKFQRLAPRFMDELMQIGVAATARRMPQLMERVRQEIEAWRSERERAEPRQS